MLSEKQYQGIEIGVSRNLPYSPYQDEVILVDGHHTIKVERWRIEYYIDEISGMLNVPANYTDSYFDLIVQMLQLPLFWEYFTDEERHNIESELVDAFDFSLYIEGKKNIAPSIFVLDEIPGQNEGYRFRQFEIGKTGLLSALKDAFAFMDQKDYEAGLEYAAKSDSRDFIIEQLQQQVQQLQYALDACIKELETLRYKKADIGDVTIKEENKHYPLYIIGKKIYLCKDEQISDKPVESLNLTEIRLAPLDKAVYFLFLDHPEGINFSYLPDYREELLGIYQGLMDYRTNASMIRSVEDVTDPTNNSINEKCARIRRAFTKELGSQNAASYCIMGPRGDAKRIALDRDLVKKM